MPLDSAIVGARTGEVVTAVTVRHCLAYAAGTGDLNPRYFDDARPGGIVASPLFGVALDWKLRGELTELTGLPAHEAVRGVHATQDMAFHRLVHPGDVLTTSGTVVRVQQRPPGAYLVARYETVDARHQPVVSVDYGIIYRGVQVSGPNREIDAVSPLDLGAPLAAHAWTRPVEVAREAPHIYSECADIYNPIHTERAVALAAGLPDIIVHGTLTLAYAVRTLVDREASGDPAVVRRLACRFGAYVIPGTVIEVVLSDVAATPGGRALRFAVLNEAGEPAIRDGVLVVAG
jgi:acyl dehydratase